MTQINAYITNLVVMESQLEISSICFFSWSIVVKFRVFLWTSLAVSSKKNIFHESWLFLSRFIPFAFDFCGLLSFFLSFINKSKNNVTSTLFRVYVISTEFLSLSRRRHLAEKSERHGWIRRPVNGLVPNFLFCWQWWNRLMLHFQTLIPISIKGKGAMLIISRTRRKIKT